MNFENHPQLGFGIYTATEIAQILRLPKSKIRFWMSKYWDGKLGAKYGSRYSWDDNGARAVSFHTFIEFYVMMRFSEAGVKPAAVLKAHNALVKQYDTYFPFALRDVLDGIRTDGKKIFLHTDDGTIDLDGTQQFNLDFIKVFFQNLDFGDDELAIRFWPLGKDKSILIDPGRRFGQPVVDSKNIEPEILFNHHKAGDPIRYIAHVYNLTEEEVSNAIDYCRAA